MHPSRRPSIRPLLLCLIAAGSSLPLAAHAYVGPGAGLGLLAALWGLLAAVGVALLYVVMWPIRRMRRRRKAELAARAQQPQRPPLATQADAQPQAVPLRRNGGAER